MAHTICNEGSEWESLEIKNKYVKMEVDYVPKSVAYGTGSLDITLSEEHGGTLTIYLDQDDIKALISHLQKQLK
jgi:hypothetical protein